MHPCLSSALYFVQIDSPFGLWYNGAVDDMRHKKAIRLLHTKYTLCFCTFYMFMNVQNE